MPTVYLGNTAPIETHKLDSDSDAYERVQLDIERSITTFNIPDNTKLAEALVTVTKAYDEHHSNEPPAWVESSNEALAAVLADNYSDEEYTVKIGRPDDWETEE